MPQFAPKIGPQISQRAFEQAIAYAQAISVTSKGFVLSAMVQKDIPLSDLLGHGGFHNSAVGSGPRYVLLAVSSFLDSYTYFHRAYRNLRGLVRGFDSNNYDEDIDILALNYGPFVNFLALTRYVFCLVFSTRYLGSPALY